PPGHRVGSGPLSPGGVLRVGGRGGPQLEDGVAGSQRAEILGWRTCRHREVALHGELESVEVGLQHLGLLPISQDPHPELFATAALPERDPPARPGVSNPLGLAAPRDQEPFPAMDEDVDRRRVEAPAATPPNLELIVVRETETETDQGPED